MTTVSLFPVNLGDLAISCPECGCSTDTVYFGISTVEEGDSESELPNLEQVGVVVFPCGDNVITPCLAEKVARILNAREDGALRLGMLNNLIECKEHGVEFPDQS